MKCKALTVLGLTVLMTGCGKESAPKTVASIGQAGSLGGYYGISRMVVGDINGGGAGFGYGSVSGCCASASIGIGVPSSIEGEWRSGWTSDKSKEEWREKWEPRRGEFPESPTWYRIKSTIDSEQAEKKILTMNRYYKNHTANPVMRVLVDGDKVMLFYGLSCTPELNDDCTVRENADPNGWVITSPNSKHKGATVVKLFEGKGESSTSPY
ncbi:hypothetical protein [Vibrio sp. D431a]|uniref:hypothetical protein n=1 Tax=Vibrio sp. D431a TaxID=2837388 RepID=UPI002554CDA7|nr:hypothetical protein [Vibrio sp. D431a]MDK9790031.1 hypothetical protein [Vibrio sp. D431a]